MSREVQFAAAGSEIHVIFHQAAQSSSRSLSAVSISMKFQCDESETVVILINIIFRSVSRDDRIRLHCCQKKSRIRRGDYRRGITREAFSLEA